MKHLSAIVLTVGICMAAMPVKAETQSSDDIVVMIFDEIERAILQDYGTTPDAVELSHRSGGHYRGPDKVPPGHMPGPGQCRAWVFGEPPGHQQPAGDCASVAASMPSNAELIYGGPARGATLPTGYGVDLPQYILDELPRRTDTERIVVDDDIILVDRNTRIILDILTDVIRQN
jgi:hypothetical protein